MGLKHYFSYHEWSVRKCDVRRSISTGTQIKTGDLFTSHAVDGLCPVCFLIDKIPT